MERFPSTTSMDQSFKSYYEESPGDENDKLGAYSMSQAIQSQNMTSQRFPMDLTLPPRIESKYQEKLKNAHSLTAKNITPNDHALQVSLSCEFDKGLSYNGVHKMWAMLTIRTKSSSSPSSSIIVNNNSSSSTPNPQQQFQQQPNFTTPITNGSSVLLQSPQPTTSSFSDVDNNNNNNNNNNNGGFLFQTPTNGGVRTSSPLLSTSSSSTTTTTTQAQQQQTPTSTSNASILKTPFSSGGVAAAASTAMYLNRSSKTPIDFVVVIDHSSSMKLHNKLAYVQATIEFIVSELDEWHRFCLIQFNQEAQVLTPLVEMTAENKKYVLNQLRTIKAEGSTNLSQPLFAAISQLTGRRQEDRFRISSIMLLTDGLANTGLKGTRLLKQLMEMKIPAGLTIHSFGYGSDHDSSTLQSIALASKGGVYHYIESPEVIASTFGECLAGIMSTAAHNIDVRVTGADGCRIINFYTKFPVETKEDVKDYVVSMGSMYAEESKSILMKLSLRKMAKALEKHQLLKVTVNYTNTALNQHQLIETWLELTRPEVTPAQTMPIELDRHINRFMAATAIEEAVRKAMEQQYGAAQQQLIVAIDTIKQSVSAKDASSANYCEDLVSDLRECAEGMENPQIFNAAGIHYAHSYSTMYFLERSTGAWNLRGIKIVMAEQEQQEHKRTQQRLLDLQTRHSSASVSSGSNHSSSSSSSMSNQQQQPTNPLKRRHEGYGYLTEQQEQSAKKAFNHASHYVTGYLDEFVQDL